MNYEEELGATAYRAYFDKCGGKSLISGAPLPAWMDQSVAIREAWIEAAHAVAMKVRNVEFYA